MEIDYTYNFNDPMSAIVIFRVPNTTGGPPTEYGGEMLFAWEDIKAIEQYVFPDDWIQHKGEKYYLTLYNDPNSKLVFGSFESMKTYWTMFRNKFGQFGDKQHTDEEDENND